MMTVLSVSTFLVILAVLVRCLAFIGVLAFQSLNRWQQTASLASVLVVAAFFMRPHEDVFQGLDSSAYRLMEHAFESGRGFTGVDNVLKEVPESLRIHMLLLPNMDERNTRDRSFEITSPSACTYKPFFYPLLPMAMRGLDVLVPGRVADYFIPLIATLFFGTMLIWSVSRMGLLGCLAVPALFLASPLPAWLMRGCHVEALSAVFLSTALLVWLDSERLRPIPLAAYGALGLAVSFHPVMMIPAVCLAGPMLMTEPRFSRIVLGVLVVLCGVMPILLLTVWVCQPYGALTWANLKFGVAVSASIQSAIFGAGAVGVLALVLILLRGPCLKGLARMNTGYARYVLSALLLLIAAAPTWLAVEAWRQKTIVQEGLRELESGLKVFPSIVLGLLGVVALMRRRQSALGILAVGLSLPMFLYLKGAEQMGLWSQRRLIAPYVLYITAALPALCWVTGRFTQSGRLRLIRQVVWAALLVAVGIGNGVGHRDTWLAPYQIQYEHGADKWVAQQRAAIGSKLTVSDTYGYTLPLAVDGKTRILGLGEKGMTVLPDVMTWLGDRARIEDVLWLTAFENPGMEEGVAFESYRPFSTQVLWRARAKYALPAIRERTVVQTQLLRVVPIGSNAPPVMDKLMDPGVLGLREPWGRCDKPIKLPGGLLLPARWSRENSGIVGPVPPPGGSVRISIYGENARVDDVPDQGLIIQPPWVGEPLTLAMSKTYGMAEGIVSRTNATLADATNDIQTGVYHLHSTHPYNPATANIKNFNRDLGALIHRIRIEVVPDAGGAGPTDPPVLTAKLPDAGSIGPTPPRDHVVTDQP